MTTENLTDAFTTLRRKFLRLAMRFLPSEEDANDALQEAFCRLWPRVNLIDSAKEAEAMAVTTIKHLCIDEVRKHGRVQEVNIDSGCDNVLTDSSDEIMERDEQYLLVEQIIDNHLSPLQKQIIRWREYDELSFEEIGEKLNMQPATVRVNVSRARKQIREIYLNLIEPRKRV